MGRPAFEPTAEQRNLVENLVAFGIPQSGIVQLVHHADGEAISPATLRRHFRKELDLGLLKANAQIAQTLYRKALAGNDTLLIFWMKTRGGWRENARGELPDDDLSPSPRSPLTDAQRQAIQQALHDEVRQIPAQEQDVPPDGATG